MGRTPCCSKVGLHRGPWTPTEDSILSTYILTHGEGQWRSLPTNAGLLRCGKSCRLRWMNYLRPDIKRGDISPDEDDLIIRMHALLGNRWSLIAGRLPGRTDNEIKNYWNTHLSKQLLSQGTDPVTHKKLSHPPPKPKRKHRPKKKRPATTTVKPLTTFIKPDEQVKVVVYQPKPIRVRSLRLVSSFSRSSSSSMTRNSSFESSLTNGVAPPCYNLCAPMVMEEDPELAGGRVEFLIGEDDVEPLPPHVSSDLDKLYQEYFQLIKADHHTRDLDSFAHSLLI